MIFEIKKRVWPAAGIFHAEVVLNKMSAGAVELAEQFGLGEVELGGVIPYGEGQDFTLPTKQRPIITGVGFRIEIDLADDEAAEAKAQGWTNEIESRLQAAVDALAGKSRTVGETTSSYIPS